MASVRKRKWKHKGVEREAWVVAYTDQSGKRRIQTFDKKKEAETAKTQIELEIASGSHVAASQSLTVAKACEMYLRHYEQRVKAKEVGRFGYNTKVMSIDKYIIPALGSTLLTDLTFVEVEAFHGKIAQRLAPSTAKGHLLVFKLVEDFARKRGFTKKSVVGEVSSEVSGKRGRIKTFTTEQVKELLLVLDARTAHQRHRAYLFLRCAVHLAAFCGLRFGEIAGLTLANIDRERNLLYIRHSLTLLDELKGPKTAAGVRDVPIPAGVMAMIEEWIGKYYIPNDRFIVFRDVRGGQYARSGFHRNLWHRLLKKAGLFNEHGDQFHFHALRHFAASAMIEMGIPLTDVASLLGHEKFDMTLQVYAHPIVGGHRRHEAVERMSSWLSPQRDNNATTPSNELISL